MDLHPLTSVSSLVFASWLQDADEPLKTFRSLSTCSLQWGLTRPRVLWLIAPLHASTSAPRPSVAGDDGVGLCVWSLLDPSIPIIKPVMVGIQPTSGVPPILWTLRSPSSPRGVPTVGVQYVQGYDPLDLEVGDLPGV